MKYFNFLLITMLANAQSLVANKNNLFSYRQNSSGLTELHHAIENNSIDDIDKLKRKTDFRIGLLKENIPTNENMFHNSFFLEYKNIIFSIEWSPDGSSLITASADNTAKIWSLKDKSNTILNEIQLTINDNTPDSNKSIWSSDRTHDGWVRSAKWSPNGNYIITASYDNIAKIWYRNNFYIASLEHNGLIFSTAWSPNSTFIATISNNFETKVYEVKIWNLQGNCVATFKHFSWVTSVAWLPNSTHIVTASWGKKAIVWDLQQNLFKGVAFLKHKKCVTSVACSPDSSLIATSSKDTIVKIWDWQGNLKATLHHGDSVNKVAWSPDSLSIATSSRNFVKIWNWKGIHVATLKHSASVRSIAWSPNSSEIATASWDKTVMVWDLQKNQVKCIAILEHENPVESVAWSPDGTRIATTSWGNIANIWSMTGTPIDYAVRNALNTKTTIILEKLLDEAASLDGCMSSYLLASLCHVAKNIRKHDSKNREKKYNQKHYKFICDILKLLIDKPGCPVDRKDKTGKTSFEWAQQYGLDEIAHFLRTK